MNYRSRMSPAAGWVGAAKSSVCKESPSPTPRRLILTGIDRLHQGLSIELSRDASVSQSKYSKNRLRDLFLWGQPQTSLVKLCHSHLKDKIREMHLMGPCQRQNSRRRSWVSAEK